MNLSREIKLTKVGRTIKNADIEIIEEMFKDGKLETLQKIGSGCFGVVYKYTSLNGKTFAIKYSKQYYSGANVERAYDIETLLELRGNKYIPRIHAYDNTSLDGQFIMIVDFIDGVSIADYRNQFRLNTRFVENFKKTLDIMVSKKITLNDLHGHNILVEKKSGIPIIIDFGGCYKTQYNIISTYTYDVVLDRIKGMFQDYVSSTAKTEVVA
jgi:predicted Ser/Thr protein kinase